MSDNGHSDEDYQIKVDDHRKRLPEGPQLRRQRRRREHGHVDRREGQLPRRRHPRAGHPQLPRPSCPRASSATRPITAMDWYPTILELCGVDPPEGVELDGHSVLAAGREPSAPSRIR